MNGERIGIAGVGLIGGSIGLRARASSAFVIGYDLAPAATSRAQARGAIDAVAPDLVALARQCDTLVIALPVDATSGALAQLAGMTGATLILDVASVKRPFVTYAARLPAYIGTHPLAGREHGGIDAADARLFDHAVWAHVPHPETALVERLRGFITAMGARPFEIDAARHDAIVALTSHLPQALSVALGAELAAAGAADPAVTELCGPGIRSMLRLARSPEAIWEPIVRANGRPIAARLRSLAKSLIVAAEGLERGDSAQLMSYFGAAGQVSRTLEERFSTRSRS